MELPRAHELTGAAPGTKSIWNSTCRVGGRDPAVCRKLLQECLELLGIAEHLLGTHNDRLAWTFLLEVSLNSALKTSRSLTRSGALLVVNVVGISRTPTVTGDVAKFVALIALWSTWTVMVIDPVPLPIAITQCNSHNMGNSTKFELLLKDCTLEQRVTRSPDTVPEYGCHAIPGWRSRVPKRKVNLVH
ncbi:hypothetical protein Tco_1563501 [Tanacetum coccineum]